jgi:hypothetical protein
MDADLAEPAPAARLGDVGLWTTRPVEQPVDSSVYRRCMCRSIKTLRPPFTAEVSDDDVRAAALQYVRKVSGFHVPAAHNAETFQRAVDDVAAATTRLLDTLQVRGQRVSA